MFKVLALALVLWSSQAWAIPAHDATTTGTATGVNTITVNHTVGGACTNRFNYITVAWQKTPVGTLNTLTVAGNAATFIDGQTHSSVWRIEHWYYIAPATGSSAVVATFDSDPKNSITMRVSSYCDTHQTVPIGTPAKTSGSGTAISLSVTSATNELVVDGAQTSDDPNADGLTVGVGQTQRANFSQAATNHVHGGSEETGAASVNMQWTANVGSTWAIVGVSLKPSPAPATGGRSGSVINFH